MTQVTHASRQRGILSIEVLLDESTSTTRGFRVAEVKARVADHLHRNYREVQVGQIVQLGLPLATCITRVAVSGYSRSLEFPDNSFYVLEDVDLDIVVYTLCSQTDRGPEPEDDDDEGNDSSSQQFSLMKLPHADLEGLWDSLIYDDSVKDWTLRALLRGMQERRDASTARLTGMWQNTLLLHGPPGSGKTSLAQALAQKLSIRLLNIYSRTVLVEVRSSTLLSRYFGESSKRVADLFRSITDMSLDESQLTIVFFDEVESVAGCRQAASATNEVGDAIRSTNEILQGLDDLRSRLNVIFIFTSNMFANLDDAFISRCFITEFINGPSMASAFEILRSELNGLIEAKKVYWENLVYHLPATNGDQILNDSSDSSCSIVSSNGAAIVDPLPSGYIPSKQWAEINWPRNTISAVSELQRIASVAKGLSGRNLRGLITLARLRHTVDDPCELRDLLIALEVVVCKRIGQSRSQLESAAMSAASEEMEIDETEGIEDFLAQLEGREPRGLDS